MNAYFKLFARVSYGLLHIDCPLPHRGGWISGLFGENLILDFHTFFFSTKIFVFTGISRKEIQRHQNPYFLLKLCGFPGKNEIACGVPDILSMSILTSSMRWTQSGIAHIVCGA